MTTDVMTRRQRIAEMLGDRLDPGERFIASRAFQDLDLNAGRRRTPLVTVRDAEETAQALQTRASLAVDTQLPEVAGPTLIEPRPADVLGAGLTIVPLDPANTQSIFQRQEDSSSGSAGGHDAGTDPSTASAIAEWSATFASADAKPVAVKVSARVAEDVFRDSAATRQAVNTVSGDLLAQEVERQVLVGAGSASTELDGFLSDANRTTLVRDSANGETRHAAIRRAVTSLQTNGWRRAIALVAHPDDLEAVDTEVDSSGNYLKGSGVLDAIGPRIPSEHLTAGTVAVASLPANVLWVTDVSVAITDSHGSDFIAGWLALKAQIRGSLQTVSSSLVEVTL